mgnify:FL=1
MFALMAELKGKVSREGFESLGFSSTPRVAVYTLGPLPVFKMDLSDPAKFDALLTRIEQRSGLERTTEKVGEHTFWSYRTASEMLLVMTVQHRQVVLGLVPDSVAATFVSHIVGESKPATPVREDGLRKIATTWGFEPFLIGYVDLARIAQMVVAPQPGLNEEMLRALQPSSRPASTSSEFEW